MTLSILRMSRLGLARSTRRRGFTLVELLVVIAIIGVLVGLLLPAVQSAREAARRMQCSNNLKQLGLSLQNYHDTFKGFPQGVVLGPGKATPYTLAYHHTWMSAILPYMEQNPLYNSINFAQRAWQQPFINQKVPTFQCPSDSGYRSAADAHGGIFTPTSYAGSEGFHWWETATVGAGWSNLSDPMTKSGDLSGLFAINRKGEMGEITDGTSNTIVIAETDTLNHGGGPFMTAGTGERRVGNEGVFRVAFVATMYAGWGANEGGTRVVNVDGTSKSNGTFFRNSKYTWCPTYITAWGPNVEHPGASGPHTNGLQTAFADGSVAFISEQVDYGAWVKLNATSDNNIIARDPRN